MSLLLLAGIRLYGDSFIYSKYQRLEDLLQVGKIEEDKQGTVAGDL
jgi:hypothetical protein